MAEAQASRVEQYKGDSIPSLQVLCVEQIARDIRSYHNVPLPAEWHDRLYRILAASGRLTPDSLLPLLRSRSCGDALATELGSRSALALGSVGFRALAAANLSHSYMCRRHAGLQPAGTLRSRATL